MGFAYQKLKDYDKAIKCFDDSMLNFTDPRIKSALKEVENLKKKHEAENYIDPVKAEEANKRGNDLYNSQTFPDSIKEYSEAIKRDPTKAKYYSNRAASYIKVMSLSEALSDCEKALSLDPGFLKAHQRYANVQILMKRYHKAMTTYEKALKLFPEDSELRDGYNKCVLKINESGDDEERTKQSMNDPEIQALMIDPRVQQMLKELRENPQVAMIGITKDEFLNSTFKRLIAAGLIKTK